jgi:hypothetical protein
MMKLALGQENLGLFRKFDNIVKIKKKYEK